MPTPPTTSGTILALKSHWIAISTIDVRMASMKIVNSCGRVEAGAWKFFVILTTPPWLLDVLQQRAQQADDRHDEQDRDHRTGEPADAVALDRDEQVALDGVAEHRAEDERRPRPLELLHAPADQAEEQQRVEVAPLPGRLERADVDDAHHRRQDQAEAQRRQLARIAG